MTRRVLIAGSGIAALAAAWSARRRGHEVIVARGGAGATALGGGAVDDRPWEELCRAARALGSEITSRPLPVGVAVFAAELGIWTLPEGSAPRLATAAGRIRPARGHDRGLLDLDRLRGTLVILPRVDRAGWDADALAKAFAAEPFARARQISFAAVDLPVLRFEEERRIADGDLAARHDDAGRLAWLAGRIRDGLGRAGGAGAVLLGPWLGADAARAEALTAAVGLPVGEILVGVGSPAGLRFEAARERMLAALAVRARADRVASVTRVDGRLAVTLERDGSPISVDAVVLAVGGLIGGGLTYVSAEHASGVEIASGARAPFALSLAAPVAVTARVGHGGAETAEAPSSLHGPELALAAWPAGDRAGVLESAGVRCAGVRAAAGITAAGDVIAGRPRTLLEAVASGLRAGAEA